MTNMHHYICIQVHANGVVSFNGPPAPVTPHFPLPVANRFVLAPFWTEPVGLTATIEYEVYDVTTVGTDVFNNNCCCCHKLFAPHDYFLDMTTMQVVISVWFRGEELHKWGRSSLTSYTYNF